MDGWIDVEYKAHRRDSYVYGEYGRKRWLLISIEIESAVR